MDTKVMTEPEAVEALNKAFDYLKIKGEAQTCSIVGPLYRYTAVMEPTALDKLEKPAGRKAMAMVMKSVAPPVVVPNFIGGTVQLDFMFAEHPVVKFAEMAAKLAEQKPGFILPIILGATNVDQLLARDLAAMPHLLIAGTTGSGKSMMLHSIIASLLPQPDVKLILLDPKMVEFSRYDELPQLAYDVGNTVDDCAKIVSSLDDRMRSRLAKIAEAGCKDIQEYRQKGGKMSYLVVIIDELADLVRAKKTEFSEKLCSLAEKSRAAGIHIIAATQHPSRDVVTGPIKANFPSRIACKVATHTHSSVILDAVGAENLTGQGDALLIDGVLNLVRFKGALVDLAVGPEPSKEEAQVKKQERQKSGLFGRFASAVMAAQARRKAGG